MRGQLLLILARYIIVLGAVVLLNFAIPRFLPGDPLRFAGGGEMQSAVPLSEPAREQLRSYYHLDKPMGEQLIGYLTDLSRGDLGWSIARSAPVSELILDRLPWTVGLLLVSILISAVVGSALGIVAGWIPGGARDRLLTALMAALAAVPEFLVAIGLLLVFAIGLGWFPLAGGRTVFLDTGANSTGMVRQTIDILWHLTLPAAALVATGTSGFLLLTRDSMSGLRNEAWLALARAKGLSETRMALRHALPNLLLPILTYAGLRFGSILGGALVVERVFGIPGIGMLTFEAVQARDYPVLQTVFLLSSTGVLTANLIVEMLYLRLERRRGPAGHA